MKIKIVQLVVEKDLDKNKKNVLRALEEADQDDWMVFPEAIISGYYPHEKNYTSDLQWSEILHSLEAIKNSAIQKKCHCIIGSATKQADHWYNSVMVFSYRHDLVQYDKIKLSKLDRMHFKPGAQIGVFGIDEIRFGILACRELIFPEQWSELKGKGVQVIFHINNAIHPHDALWKHLLISRAIENSIFVISVNNAEFPQQLPSFIISPRGEILAESSIQKAQICCATIDLEQVISNLEEREDY